MSQIETEHRGYKIVWSDNQDLWSCHEMGLQNVSLNALKQRIDAIERQHRKMAVRVLWLRYSGETKEAVVCSVDEDRARVWVTTDATEKKWNSKTRDYAEKLRRERASVGELCADTPENRALCIELRAALEAEREAQQRKKRALDAIPRLDREQLLALAKEMKA